MVESSAESSGLLTSTAPNRPEPMIQETGPAVATSCTAVLPLAAKAPADAPHEKASAGLAGSLKS